MPNQTATYIIYLWDQSPTMIRNISLSVSLIPSLPSFETLTIVFSMPFFTIPSPPLNSWPSLAISRARNAASMEDAIFAAQDGFAPSHMIPEVMARQFTMACLMTLSSSCIRYAIPAPAAQPALTAPQ